MPPTLTAASKAGSATERRTSICAARWKTTSGRASATSGDQRRRVGDRRLVQRRAPAREVLAPAGREVVDDPHLVAAREQRVDEVGADEAGAAGDESAHGARQ